MFFSIAILDGLNSGLEAGLFPLFTLISLQCYAYPLQLFRNKYVTNSISVLPVIFGCLVGRGETAIVRLLFGEHITLSCADDDT